MKKTMRKLAAAGLAVGLMTCAVPGALAADADKSGMYGFKDAAGEAAAPDALGVTEISTAAATVGPATATINGQTVTDYYAEAEKFGVSYTATDGDGYHMIFLLKEDAALTKAIPTESSIYYINQSDTSITNGSTVSFPTVYPKDLTEGTYGIYQSQTGGTGLNKLGSFEYYQAYKLGDANSSGGCDINDAVAILEYLVDKNDLSPNQMLAANVADRATTSVDINDAVRILEYLVDKGTLE